MSDSVLAAIVIPIVVAVALAGWIFAVYHANRHPRRGGQPEAGPNAVPNRDVAGGAFRATEGGRQLSPRRDAPPAEAVPGADSRAGGAGTAPGGTAGDTAPGGRRR